TCVVQVRQQALCANELCRGAGPVGTVRRRGGHGATAGRLTPCRGGRCAFSARENVTYVTTPATACICFEQSDTLAGRETPPWKAAWIGFDAILVPAHHAHSTLQDTS